MTLMHIKTKVSFSSIGQFARTATVQFLAKITQNVMVSEAF